MIMTLEPSLPRTRQGKNTQWRVFIHIVNGEGWDEGIWKAPLTDEEKEFWIGKRGKTHVSYDMWTLIEQYVYPYVYFASYTAPKSQIRAFFKPSMWKYAKTYYAEAGYNTPSTFYSLIAKSHRDMTFGFLQHLAQLSSFRQRIPSHTLQFIGSMPEIEIEGNNKYIDAFLYTIHAQYRVFVVSTRRYRESNQQFNTSGWWE
jgi:hypothetical protein